MFNERQVQKPSRRRESIHGARSEGLIRNPEGLADGAVVVGSATNTCVFGRANRAPHASRFHHRGA